MSAIRSYRDLLVWQKAMNLVDLVYEITKSFPPDELYGLTNQLRRSSVSIPSNIAEGYGRHQTKDYIRFLSISSGSLYEMETQLEISRRQGYVDQEKYDEVISLSSEIERMLSSLINKLKRTINK